MTRTSTVGVPSHPGRTWWVVAGVLLMIGSGCAILGLRQMQHPLAGPAVPHAPHKGHPANKQPIKTVIDIASEVAPLQVVTTASPTTSVVHS